MSRGLHIDIDGLQKQLNTAGQTIFEAYVATAVGRDYRNATPIRGSYWGTGDREMRLSVHVEAK